MYRLILVPFYDRFSIETRQRARIAFNRDEMPFNYHSLPALSTNYVNVIVEIVLSATRATSEKLCCENLYVRENLYSRVCVCVYFFNYNAYVRVFKKYSRMKRNCREITVNTYVQFNVDDFIVALPRIVAFSIFSMANN